jgi:kelch-like protein 19
MPSMNNRRRGCGVATRDKMLYVVGGFDGSRTMDSVERFDPIRNAWETIPFMNSRRLITKLKILLKMHARFE